MNPKSLRDESLATLTGIKQTSSTLKGANDLAVEAAKDVDNAANSPLSPSTSLNGRVDRLAHSGPTDLDPGCSSAHNAFQSHLNCSTTKDRASLSTRPAAVKRDSIRLVSRMDIYENELAKQSADDRDLRPNYDDFPDGNSISTGTPSRFLKHAKPPASHLSLHGNVASNANFTQSMSRTGYDPTTLAPALKPTLGWPETSTSKSDTANGLVSCTLKPSNETITSPRSFHSGSSSNRTAIREDDRTTAFLADLPRSPLQAEKSPASPGRTFRGFLRRLSSSGREVRTEREQSPLPTLTSTPSSAYMNVAPREARRSSTSHGGDC